MSPQWAGPGSSGAPIRRSAARASASQLAGTQPGVAQSQPCPEGHSPLRSFSPAQRSGWRKPLQHRTPAGESSVLLAIDSMALGRLAPSALPIVTATRMVEALRGAWQHSIEFEFGASFYFACELVFVKLSIWAQVPRFWGQFFCCCFPPESFWKLVFKLGFLEEVKSDTTSDRKRTRLHPVGVGSSSASHGWAKGESRVGQG